MIVPIRHFKSTGIGTIELRIDDESTKQTVWWVLERNERAFEITKANQVGPSKKGKDSCTALPQGQNPRNEKN